MDYVLLTPGPTPLPPSVYAKLSEPILHHRTHEFGAIFEKAIADLQYVFRTKNDVLMVTSSGSGAMESTIANLLSPGAKIIIHSTGVFGDRFVKIAKAYGLNPVVISEPWGCAAVPEKLQKELVANSNVEAVFFQHTDTSTGIVNDLKKLSRTVREYSDALVVVDAISGLAAEELEMDAWNLDVVVSGSQKGLMAPPGLAFMAISKRAWAAVENAKLPKFYFDWTTMRKAVAKKQTPYTPAVMLVVAQAEALSLIREEGIENVWKRTAELASYTRDCVAKLGLKLFAKNPADILTAVNLPEGVDGKKLIKDILTEDRISIAGGQQQLEGKIIRISHMGFVKKNDIDAGIEAVKKRLSVSHV